MKGTSGGGKTLVTMTCSTGSAGTSASTDTHSNCTFAGTAISALNPEPKSSGSLPSVSRSEIHYPTVLHSSSPIYITKKKRKLVRFFTVVAYMFAVSLVAIVLSLYYVFLWNPYLVSLPAPNAPVMASSGHSPGSETPSTVMKDTRSLSPGINRLNDTLNLFSPPSTSPSPLPSPSSSPIPYFMDFSSSSPPTEPFTPSSYPQTQYSILGYMIRSNESTWDNIYQNEVTEIILTR